VPCEVGGRGRNACRAVEVGRADIPPQLHGLTVHAEKVVSLFETGRHTKFTDGHAASSRQVNNLVRLHKEVEAVQ